MIPIKEEHNPDESKMRLTEVVERHINSISLTEALNNDDPDDTLYSADSVKDLLRWLDGEE